MTPSELKYQVEQAGHESYFFERKTMKFFGDTMKNYGVRDGGFIKTSYDENGNYCPDGCTIECWELYRKRPVKHGLQESAFFSKQTFKKVFKGV